MNRTILAGRLTRDAELRYTQNDIAVASFTIAVKRNFPGADGEYETDFFKCVAWRKQAENTSKYTQKGDLIGVDGNLQNRSYTDNHGLEKSVTEIVCNSVYFLNTNRDGNKQNINEEDQNINEEDPFYKKSAINISDDDLPF